MLGDLFWVLIALGAAFAGATVMYRGSSRRRRQVWISEELARQEAAAPGGRFSEEEYLARLDALEERWDSEDP